MNLRRQLMLVSLLTLVLPWAGCQFIRETESALREGQQRMLGGTAQAIADSLAQFPDHFDVAIAAGDAAIYAHPLDSAPLIDGYADDWSLPEEALVRLPGRGDDMRYALAVHGQHAWLYLEVGDDVTSWSRPADDETAALEGDSVTLISADADGGNRNAWRFAPEAPGMLSPLLIDGDNGTGEGREMRIHGFWLDTAGGWRLEARLPRRLLGARLGIVVRDIDSPGGVPAIRQTHESTLPRLVTPSPFLQSVLGGYLQPGLRLTVLDKAGWRLAEAGEPGAGDSGGRSSGLAAGWLRVIYDTLLEPDGEAVSTGPHPSGREAEDYVRRALAGEAATSGFRSTRSGRAVVSVAQPIWSGNVQTGVVILQQGTDAILSLTNRALVRLMNFTALATLLVALGLLGYASWLSLRIRRLSAAAASALDGERVQADLPSAGARDEVGDLSRSFSRVLRQLGDYNDYLRRVAARLSHEMRTPLTIVTSSLENLEHEPLTAEGASYTARARDGADRLRRILNAMSEASRVEALIENAEAETFDLREVLAQAVAAYADAWPERRFAFRAETESATIRGAPELVIQMLDKLVHNAVGFSRAGDCILLRLAPTGDALLLSVTNPGPPLPEQMRSRLFDSMVSLRSGEPDRHLGFGLFIARLIAVGHGGGIAARNVEGGVRFEVTLPRAGGAGSQSVRYRSGGA